MKKESNEVRYKLAELLLKRMHESGLISEEERGKIAVLNIETFSPELAKVYPQIITHEEAEAVRSIMEYRSRTLNMNGERCQNRYIFSSKIICGDCGSHFRRQKIYIGKPYEKIIWTCHKHVEDKESCHMKAIREDVLQQAFVDMWNKLYTNQGTVLEPLLKALTELVASKPDIEEIEQLDNEIHSLSEQSQILNQVMKKGYMDSALFMEKNNLLAHRLTECRRRKTLLARKYKLTKEIVSKRQILRLPLNLTPLL